jgi:general secretion pathway protein H
MPVVWQTANGGTGFEFAGLPPPGLPRTWLNSDTRAAPGVRVVLGPEPLIEPQALALSNANAPGKSLWVVTDGLRPFKVQSTPDTTGARP